MATVLHASGVAVNGTDDNKAACSPRENGASADYFAQSNVNQPSEELASLLPAEVPDTVKPSTPCRRHVPWFAWPLLVASLVAFSSAAVVFASIPDVPTCTLAAWRLQLTTFLLTPAAVYQYLHLSAGTPLDTLLLGCIHIDLQMSIHVVHFCRKQQIPWDSEPTQVPADDRKRLCMDILLMLASGAFLGVHFFFWVWVS